MNYAENGGYDVEIKKLDDDEDGMDDIVTADFKKGGKRTNDYEEESNEDEPMPDDDDDIEVRKSKGAKKPAAKAGSKRKSDATNGDDETPQKKRKAPQKSSAAAKKREKEDIPENAEMQAIFDSIPTVRPPTPSGKDDEGKKFDFRGGHANSGPAPAAGSRDIPTGAENCLAGLSFVFTGLLQCLGREEGQNLVKRYGGRVLGQPSSRTSYVVLGQDAGPKKLQTIRENNIKAIDEDGLLELIRRCPANGGDSKAAAKNQEKKQAEIAKIEKQAAEAEKQEMLAAEKQAKKNKDSNPSQATASSRTDAKGPATGFESRLWTVKYTPTQVNQICGNKVQVEKLQRWLRAFPKNLRTKFKMAGADGSGTFRALIMHGPPGIGKTTAAHLVAKLEGYDVVESNASDSRSKKLVDTALKGVLSTTSLLGYFAGDGEQVESSKKKLVLIMDEVDGMSAGDRGGVGALAAVCKKTRIPMILICNERKIPKMRPFDYCTYDLQFRRPTTEQIRSRIMTIGYREGIKLPSNVVDALIEGSRADIRQVVNMLSSAKIDQESEGGSMDYEEGKKMSKAWEKHVVLRPWDIVSKILNGQLFQSGSKSTLNDKTELYFNDHEFSPLMLQENYLNTRPVIANSYRGRDYNMKVLEQAEKAANSISEGDLVDRMIHGSEQHWSLMPTHAIFSFVRPASFVAGTQTDATRFTQWLGKNSSQGMIITCYFQSTIFAYSNLGKLARAIKEIQGHMRLHSSGNRHEIRQQYFSLLWSQLVQKLDVEGKEAVPDVIELMDSYFLTKEDWDSLLELGVGPMAETNVKLETQTKATFTRLYNARSHPMPFMKASEVVNPKRASAKAKPDLEEALEESDEGDDAAVGGSASDDEQKEPKAGEEEEDADLSKDKYIKKPKKGKKGAAAGDAKGKGRSKSRGKKKADADEYDEEEDVVSPKKGKGAGVRGRPKK